MVLVYGFCCYVCVFGCFGSGMVVWAGWGVACDFVLTVGYLTDGLGLIVWVCCMC